MLQTAKIWATNRCMPYRSFFYQKMTNMKNNLRIQFLTVRLYGQSSSCNVCFVESAGNEVLQGSFCDGDSFKR